MRDKLRPNSHMLHRSKRRADLDARRLYARPVLRVYGSVAGLTMGFAGTQSDFIMPTNAMMFSERDLKENISRIGTHPLGFGLYLFDFKQECRARCGVGRQFGVMADEVEKIVPQAVALDADGFRMVNYAMLGIRIASREPKRKI